MIELRHIKKKFVEKGQVVTVAEDINLAIHEHEIVGIIGESGAGKSTLLRMLNYLVIPDDGEVVVDGENLAQVNNKELRKIRQKMAMIFQSFHLLASKTALQNVIFALDICNYPHDKQKRALELLRRVGIEEKANTYSSKLSGGEKQRVAIARALACNPKYLLCDEITSSLDPTNAQVILDLLREINRELGVTILFVSHQLENVEQFAQRILLIKDGKIEETKPNVTCSLIEELSRKFDINVLSQVDNLEQVSLVIKGKQAQDAIQYLNRKKVVLNND